MLADKDADCAALMLALVLADFDADRLALVEALKLADVEADFDAEIDVDWLALMLLLTEALID